MSYLPLNIQYVELTNENTPPLLIDNLAHLEKLVNFCQKRFFFSLFLVPGILNVK